MKFSIILYFEIYPILDTDTTGMLESIKYNERPPSSLLIPPIKEIKKPEMDKSLNVAEPNASGMHG